MSLSLLLLQAVWGMRNRKLIPYPSSTPPLACGAVMIDDRPTCELLPTCYLPLPIIIEMQGGSAGARLLHNLHRQLTMHGVHAGVDHLDAFLHFPAVQTIESFDCVLFVFVLSLQ